MAARYLKSAGGNWNVAATWSATGSGGVDSAGVPTASDDVILESGSGTLTINAAAACRSFDCTSGTGSYTGQVIHSSGFTVSIGTSSLGPGGVALKFSAGMTYSAIGSTTSNLFFVSTVTGNTITTAGQTIKAATKFNGVGGGWTLQDGWVGTSNNVFELDAGTLNLNGQTLTFGEFLTSTSSTKVLTMGASVITAVDPNSPWVIGGSGLTINAGTSSIILTAVGTFGAFTGGGFTYYDLTITSATSPTIKGTNTFHNLTRTGTAVKTDRFQIAANQVVTGTLTLTGNSLTNRLLVLSDVLGTARTLTAAAVSLTNVDFMDITGTGLGALAGYSAAFDADSIGSLSDGTNLTAWSSTGSAGAAAYYPQQGGEDNPRYYASAGPDGYPSVEFDGNAAFGVDTDILPTGNTPYTVVGRVKLRSTNDLRHGILAQGIYGTNFEYNAFRSSWASGGEAANAFLNYWYGRDLFSSASALPSVGTAFTFTVTYDPAVGRKIYINGSLVGSDSVSSRDGRGRSTDGVSARAMIGRTAGAEYLNGYVRRLATFPSALSSADRGAAETWAAGAPGTTGLSWTGTSIGDCGGNSGILFTPAVTRYWVANTGNWSATSSWSSSSGGATGASVPLAQDTVVFDSNSCIGINNTVSMDMPRACKNVDFSGIVLGGHSVICSFAASPSVSIFGNVTFLSGATSTGGVITLAGRGSQTLTSNGFSVSATVSIESPGGTYLLQDNFTSTSIMQIVAGTFDGNDHNVTASVFDWGGSNITRDIYMRSGNWFMTGTGTVWNMPLATGATLHPGTSTLLITNTSSSNKTVNCNGGTPLYDLRNTVAGTGRLTLQGYSYHNVTVSGDNRTLLIAGGGAITVTGTFSVRSAIGAIITLQQADSITLQTGAVWDVAGVATALGILISGTAGTQQQINFPAGNVISDYLNITDSAAIQADYNALSPAPSIRSGHSMQFASVNPYPIVMPSVVADKDYLLVFIVIFNNNNFASSTPTGWKKILDSIYPSSIGQGRMGLFVKPNALATDAGTTVNFSPSVGIGETGDAYAFAIQGAALGSTALHAWITKLGASGGDTTFVGPTQAISLPCFVLDLMVAQYFGTVPTLAQSGGGTPLYQDVNPTSRQTNIGVAAAEAVGTTAARTLTPTPSNSGFFGALQVALRPPTKVFAGSHSTDGGDNGGWIFADPDFTGPALAITTPLDGAVVAGMLPVAATATDPSGVSSVQWQVDGVNYHSADTTAPYSDTVDLSSQAVGAHTLSAIATDLAGNTSTATITIHVASGGLPYLRMLARQAAHLELIHPEMGFGILFTPLYSPMFGSVGYRQPRLALNLNEATQDGGIMTQDWDLAAALRALGIFTETRL